MINSISKKEVVTILEDIGILLDLRGDNPFKSRAYNRAARNIEAIDEDLHLLVERDALSSIEGIGKALDKKIRELITTGGMEYYEQLKASVPRGLTEMLNIQGLGPKKVSTLNKILGIETMGELEYACMENRLVELPGFGRKTQDKILSGIVHLKRYKERRLYAHIIEEAEGLLTLLKNNEMVISASLAGSVRRLCDTVKAIDLLVSTDNPSVIEKFFISLPHIDEIIDKHTNRIVVLLKSGTHACLHMVNPQHFPYALYTLTGNTTHRAVMTERANRLGITMKEYGLSRGGTEVPCSSEADIFSTIGMSYIPPELRENMGEIEAAENNEIPPLIKGSDIKGIFHIHSTDSDGSDTIERMAHYAKTLGMEYIGISDHSKSAYYAGGLSVDDIGRQHEVIDRLNDGEQIFHIFKGIESDILPDGSLDYDDNILDGFDFVIAAVHSRFTMPEDEMNSRIMKALENPYTTMLAHPTGRLLLAREAYPVDVKKIIDHAAKTGKICELNANPHRLDLDWQSCKYAKDRGVKIAISPDAHNVDGLNHTEFGINIARKGWLSPSDCINCLSLREVKQFLSR